MDKFLLVLAVLMVAPFALCFFALGMFYAMLGCQRCVDHLFRRLPKPH